MNYDEALKVVEEWVINTGIRKFCTEKCKGHCCPPHYSDRCDRSCLKGERKITCSIFLCDLLELRFYEYSKREHSIWAKVNNHIISVLQDAMEEYFSDFDDLDDFDDEYEDEFDDECDFNIYYNDHNKIKKLCEFDDNIINMLKHIKSCTFINELDVRGLYRGVL